MSIRRIFDHDLTLSQATPRDFQFPLFVRVRINYLPLTEKRKLAPLLERDGGYVLLVGYDDTKLPVEGFILQEEGQEPLSVNWELVVPDITLSPN